MGDDGQTLKSQPLSYGSQSSEQNHSSDRKLTTPKADSWLMDRVIVTQFGTIDATGLPDKNTLTNILKQKLGWRTQRRGNFSPLKAIAGSSCQTSFFIREVGSTLKVMTWLELSPIRQLRSTLFPSDSTTDFAGNDNFLPEYVVINRSHQESQLAWVHERIIQTRESIQMILPELAITNQSCSHLELIWDRHGNTQTLNMEVREQELAARTMNNLTSDNGPFRIRKGYLPCRSSLGLYSKAEGLLRTQLTADINKCKFLKTQCRGADDLQEIIQKFVRQYHAQVDAVLNPTTVAPGIAPVGPSQVELIDILGKIVPVASALKISEQHFRNEQVKFTEGMGYARKTLIELGAVTKIGKGLYKLVSPTKLKAIADALTLDKKPKQTEPVAASLESFDSLYARVDELTWSERMSAFSMILADMVRARRDSASAKDLMH